MTISNTTIRCRDPTYNDVLYIVHFFNLAVRGGHFCNDKRPVIPFAGSKALSPRLENGKLPAFDYVPTVASGT